MALRSTDYNDIRGYCLQFELKGDIFYSKYWHAHIHKLILLLGTYIVVTCSIQWQDHHQEDRVEATLYGCFERQRAL